jgi:D-alanyl-D-alanine carboxypeptidase/D-alanyl-D-alanine-endopeptidase (penicillin-binding protein 4)
VIASHQSAPLLEDVVATNKVSQNLHAELFLHQLGKRLTCVGSTAQGARVVRSFLESAGIDKDDFVFFDGSGLSGHDLVTPQATVKLLQYASAQPWFADWKASLPVGGVDGTLAGRFTQAPLKGHIFAKTGTLGEARALSGYLDCASGRTVIFTIMVDNHAPHSHADEAAMDRIVAAIAATN